MSFLRIVLSIYVHAVAHCVAIGVDPDCAALQCHGVSG